MRCGNEYHCICGHNCDRTKKKEVFMDISINLKIRDFSVPAFVIPIDPPGNRQDGFKDSAGIPLRELSPEVLGNLCDNFRAEVFKKAGVMDLAKK